MAKVSEAAAAGSAGCMGITGVSTARTSALLAAFLFAFSAAFLAAFFLFLSSFSIVSISIAVTSDTSAFSCVGTGTRPPLPANLPNFCPAGAFISVPSLDERASRCATAKPAGAPPI